MIRMVAIDLDGTLLDDRKSVADESAAAIGQATAAGVKVVIASARPPRAVRAFYLRLGLDTLQVNYNGALVWDEPNGRAVYHRPIPGRILRDIIAQARAAHPRVLVSCEILDKWYTDYFDREFARQFGPETARFFEPDFVQPVEQFCDLDASKLLLLGDESTLEALKTMLQQRWADSVCVVHIDRGLLQIMHAGCSKAHAVKFIADHYGIPMEQVMAIGDAANDIPMLEAAGVAVAVDNAPPDVKAVADWIAPSNNDHGVREALAHFGLCR